MLYFIKYGLFEINLVCSAAAVEKIFCAGEELPSRHELHVYSINIWKYKLSVAHFLMIVQGFKFW